MSKTARSAHLYLDIRNRLFDEISRGDRKAGAALPPETSLAQQLGVSLGTIRKALDLLESEGLVQRRPGVGTFVKDIKESLVNRFSNIRDDSGRPVHGTVVQLQCAVDQPSAAERCALQLRAGQRVLRSKRICTVKGRPYLHEDAALAIDRFPRPDSIDLAEPYHIGRLILDKGFTVEAGREIVTVAEVDDERAAALMIEPKTNVLKLDRLLWSLSGWALEWRIAHCVFVEESYWVALAARSPTAGSAPFAGPTQRGGD